MSAILTSIINVQSYIAWNTYYTHTSFLECHVNLTNFSQVLSQKKCIVHKTTRLCNVHWKHFRKFPPHILSYCTSATRKCTHEYVHDGYYLQWKQTIHQSQQTAAPGDNPIAVNSYYYYYYHYHHHHHQEIKQHSTNWICSWSDTYSGMSDRKSAVGSFRIKAKVIC